MVLAGGDQPRHHEAVEGHRDQFIGSGGRTSITPMIDRLGVLDAPTDEGMAQAMIARGSWPEHEEG